MSNRASASASASSGGIGLIGLVQAVLIIAKFVDQPWNKAYDIPWVWVFTPMYVSTGIFIVAFIVVAILAVVTAGRK